MTDLPDPDLDPVAVPATERATDSPSEAPADVTTGPSSELSVIEGELAAVESALGRLDDGSYGSCQVCRSPLDDAVLAEDPTALVCAAHLDVIAG